MQVYYLLERDKSRSKMLTKNNVSKMKSLIKHGYKIGFISLQDRENQISKFYNLAILDEKPDGKLWHIKEYKKRTVNNER
jgi:hypothetical protein